MVHAAMCTIARLIVDTRLGQEPHARPLKDRRQRRDRQRVLSCVFLAALPLYHATAAAPASRNALQPAFSDDESFAQVYTLTAQHDEETFVQIRLVLTNLGLGDRNAACNVLVLGGEGKPWRVNRKFNSREWTYSGEPNPVLSVGPCRMSFQQDKTYISVMLAGATIDITLDGAPEEAEPLYARHVHKHRFYEYAMPVRWSAARTVVNLPGEPQRELNGYGMLEQTRSTTYPSDICQGWLIFRGYGADGYFLASCRIPREEDSAAVGWIWTGDGAQGDAWASFSLRSDSKTLGGKRKEFETILASNQSFRVKSHKLLYRYSFIDALGPIIGAMVKLVVGDPVVRHYSAHAQPSPGGPAMNGVLEVMRIE